MKKTLRLLLLTCIIWGLFSSCEKLFDWEYLPVNEEIPVVEGIVTNEMKNHSVRLSLVRSDPNSPVQVITGADVSVFIGSSEFIFSESLLQPGTYLSENPFMGFSGQDILLQFSYKGTLYQASDAMVPISPSGRPIFVRSEDDSTKYSLFASSSVLYSPEAAMWEFLIHWEFLPGYEDANPDSCIARIFYYDLKVLDQGEIFAPPRQSKYFPVGAEVFLTKYSLSDEHTEFRRSLLMETEWRGGLMDLSPGIVFTNISDGGVGFFGACSVVRDTFYISGQ
jgi:hypothetical protein